MSDAFERDKERAQQQYEVAAFRAALDRLEPDQRVLWKTLIDRQEFIRSSVDHRTDQLNSYLNVLRTEAGTFRERIISRLDAIREDIGVNMARVDRVADTNVDIRAELVSLRVENTTLWKMIKALEVRVGQIETPPP